MTKQEFADAVAIAEGKEEIGVLNTDKFDGFAMGDFRPVYCTRVELAQLIRWQCRCFNGKMDGEALDQIGYYGKTRFMVVG